MSRTLLLSVRVGMVLLWLLPVLLFALHGFSTRWFYPAPFPSEWSQQTWLRVMQDPRTLTGLLNGMGIACLTALLSVLVGLPAARVLGLRQFRGRQAVWLLLFLPTVIPPLAIGMGLTVLFLQMGLAGSLAGVVLAHLIPTLPYSIFTLASAFAHYDEGYEQQARTLGASRWQVFFHLTLRLITPSIWVTLLFAFLISWSQYLLTLLIGAGRVVTLPMLLFSAAAGGNPASISVYALLFAFPPLLVLAFTTQELYRFRKML
jgi:putative spermidine/putrescine transport system permease protein